MPRSGAGAQEARSWCDQDLAEAFLLIADADEGRPLGKAIFAEMNRRAIGRRMPDEPFVERPRLWRFGPDHRNPDRHA